MSKAYLNLPNFFIHNTDKQTKTVNKKKLHKIPSYFNADQKLC